MSEKERQGAARNQDFLYERKLSLSFHLVNFHKLQIFWWSYFFLVLQENASYKIFKNLT